jgi:hypothetical protein
MTKPAEFTDAEWAGVLAAPMVAGMAVTLSDPSGLWGLLKESMASGRALLDARSDSSGVLAKAVVEALETSEGRTTARDRLKADVTGTTPAEMKARALAALKATATLVAAKSPADAPAFISFLESVAKRVAEASKEGTALGFGGVAVSDAEKAALGEITTALS